MIYSYSACGLTFLIYGASFASRIVVNVPSGRNRQYIHHLYDKFFLLYNAVKTRASQARVLPASSNFLPFNILVYIVYETIVHPHYSEQRRSD